MTATPKTPQDRKKKSAPKETTPEAVELQKVLQELDMDEVDFVEGISGISMDVLETPGQPKARFIAAVALVLGRRTNPNLSWAEVRAKGFKDCLNLIAENHAAPKAPVSALRHPDEELNKPYIA